MLSRWFFMVLCLFSSYDICGMKAWFGSLLYKQEHNALSSVDELLLQACLEADEKKAECALELGAHVNVQNRQGQTPLYIVTCANNTTLALRLIIQSKADVNISGPDGATPLIKALEHKNKILIKALLEASAHVNERAPNGIFPLMMAIELKDKELVELLLAKAHILLHFLQGVNPLDKAFELGAHEIALMLLDDAVKKKLIKERENQEKKESKLQPLVNAAYYRLPPRVTKLVRKSSKDTFDTTGLLLQALHATIVEEVVLRCIPYECNLNVQDEHGDTALLLALKKKFSRVAKALLEEGATVHVANKDGWTPLLAALYYGCGEVASLLLDKNAAIDSANIHGLTPLLAAIYTAQEAFALKLIDKGAHLECAGVPVPDGVKDCNQPLLLLEKEDNQNLELKPSSSFQRNLEVVPFLLAVEYGLEHVVEKLLEKGIDVSKVLKDGRTAVHIASAHGKTYILELLLKSKKFDSNKQDKEGWTALHCAAENKRKDCAELLIAYGADKKIKDNEGKIPYERALDSDYLKPEDMPEPGIVLKPLS